MLPTAAHWWRGAVSTTYSGAGGGLFAGDAAYGGHMTLRLQHYAWAAIKEKKKRNKSYLAFFPHYLPITHTTLLPLIPHYLSTFAEKGALVLTQPPPCLHSWAASFLGTQPPR